MKNDDGNDTFLYISSSSPPRCRVKPRNLGWESSERREDYKKKYTSFSFSKLTLSYYNWVSLLCELQILKKKKDDNGDDMSVQEYLDKHMLSRKIEDAVNAAVRSKTPDPVLFIVMFLFDPPFCLFPEKTNKILPWNQDFLISCIKLIQFESCEVSPFPVCLILWSWFEYTVESFEKSGSFRDYEAES